MTSHKPFLAEILNINVFHITQYFCVKSYKRNQWNLPNILAYISGIFNDFFKDGLVPSVPNMVPSVSKDLVRLSEWEQMERYQNQKSIYLIYICYFDLAVTLKTNGFIFSRTDLGT